MSYVIGQVLTFVTYVLFWGSRFLKSKKSLLLSEIFVKVLCIIAFFLLGSFSGIINSVFGIVRNFISLFIKNKTNKCKYISCFVLIIILTVIQFNSYEGISTIFVYICALFNAFGVLVLEEQGQRICGTIGGSFYCFFQFSIQNWLGAICELFTMLSQILSWLKYRKIKD